MYVPFGVVISYGKAFDNGDYHMEEGYHSNCHIQILCSENRPSCVLLPYVHQHIASEPVLDKVGMEYHDIHQFLEYFSFSLVLMQILDLEVV